MFDKEFYRKSLKSLINDSQLLEQLLDTMEHNQRKVKKGDNVIHLSYSGSIIPEEEVQQFEKQFESEGLQLSYRDTDVDVYASADHFDSDGRIVIQYAIEGIVEGGSFAIVSALTLWVWEKIKKLTGKRKPITSTIVSLGKGKRITYVYPIGLPSKTVKKAMDNLSRTIEKHKKKYKDVYTCDEHYTLQKDGRWNKEDRKSDKELLEILRKNVRA